MASFREEIHPFRARRGATRAALGNIRDEQLPLRTKEHGEVRGALLRLATLMHQRRVELTRTFAALGWRQTEAQQILGLAMEARGQLRCILLGFPDEDLDRAPAAGEWSVRQTLEHAYLVDARYTDAIAYAVERARSFVELPIRRPEGSGPTIAEEPLPGGVGQVLGRLHLRRDEIVAQLADISAEELAAPAYMRERPVEVRHRLHLIAAHEREHTGQVARTIRALELQQTEAEMILGGAEAARGLVEGMFVGVPDDVLTRTPPGGLPSVHDILTTAVAEEAELVEAIVSAVA